MSAANSRLVDFGKSETCAPVSDEAKRPSCPANIDRHYLSAKRGNYKARRSEAETVNATQPWAIQGPNQESLFQIARVGRITQAEIAEQDLDLYRIAHC